jgi:hypothetical protein
MLKAAGKPATHLVARKLTVELGIVGFAYHGPVIPHRRRHGSSW